jgi:hypothetical protein
LLFFSGDRPLHVIWIGDRGELLGCNLIVLPSSVKASSLSFLDMLFNPLEQQVGDLSLLEFRVMIGSLPRSSRAG